MKSENIQKPGRSYMSFFSIEMGVRLKKSNVLIKINELLDWKKIEEKLKSEREYLGGQQPYDSVKMFKAALLGQWYGLSDPELENALNVRVDFMMFSGFELMQSCPDETTPLPISQLARSQRAGQTFI